MSSTIDSFKWVPALLLMAATAHADPARMVVNYGDLNLTKPADAEILYGRLQHAAERVCQWEIGELSRKAAYQRCIVNALSDAQAQVKWPG